jgi:hypothetical protein
MSVTTMEMGRMAGGTDRRSREHRGMVRPVRRTRRISSEWTQPLVWALMLASVVALVGVLPTARDLVPPRTTAAISVTATSADTLWSIASAHRLPGMTTAQMVETIRATNGLSHQHLQAGTVLSVPVQGLAGTAFAQVTP